MKKKITIVLACLVAAGFTVVNAQGIFKPGEFHVDLFGQVATDDLDTGHGSYGFGVGGYVTENLGFGVRTSLDELSGHLFESISPRVLWRIPLAGKHALYAFGQATRTFHGDAIGWSMSAGPGYEYRLFEHFGLYGEISMLKQVAGKNRSTDTFGVGEFGLRISF